MSDEPGKDAATPKKKKGGKLKKLLIGLLLLLVVGGGSAAGALYFLAPRLHAGARNPDADLPQLLPRAHADSDAVAHARAVARRTGHVDPRLFQPTYIPITDNFTSNLAGGGSFVQVGLSLLTYYDEQVPANVETHKVAIRSAVLMTLAEADPLTVTTTEGKQRLRAALTRAINATLTEREGFGGIDSVYFTSFVTQ